MLIIYGQNMHGSQNVQLHSIKSPGSFQENESSALVIHRIKKFRACVHNSDEMGQVGPHIYFV